MSKLAKDCDEGLFIYFFDVEQVGEMIEAGQYEAAIAARKAYRVYVEALIKSGQDATKEKERLEKLEILF